MIRKLTILAVFLCLLFSAWSPLAYPALAQTQNQIAVNNSTVQSNYPSNPDFFL